MTESGRGCIMARHTASTLCETRLYTKELYPTISNYHRLRGLPLLECLSAEGKKKYNNNASIL